MIMAKRLKKTIKNGVGNVRDDFPRINGVVGGQGGIAAGVIIDGEIFKLQGEPPIAQTKGWGIVPGS
jgi:hypothetical protein